MVKINIGGLVAYLVTVLVGLALHWNGNEVPSLLILLGCTAIAQVMSLFSGFKRIAHNIIGVGKKLHVEVTALLVSYAFFLIIVVLVNMVINQALFVVIIAIFTPLLALLAALGHECIEYWRDYHGHPRHHH
jgi:hypothetical protein